MGGIGEGPARMGIIFNKDARSPRPLSSRPCFIFHADENRDAPPSVQCASVIIFYKDRHGKIHGSTAQI